MEQRDSDGRSFIMVLSISVIVFCELLFVITADYNDNYEGLTVLTASL